MVTNWVYKTLKKRKNDATMVVVRRGRLRVGRMTLDHVVVVQNPPSQPV